MSPLRKALRKDSPLVKAVANGMGAIGGSHAKSFSTGAKQAIADSMNLDDALKLQYPSEPRWDYLLGSRQSGSITAAEMHSAKTDQVTRVIAKKRAAIVQIRTEFAPGVRVNRWIWVAGGRVRFARTEKTRLQLDQAGIEFVGRVVERRHLD